MPIHFVEPFSRSLKKCGTEGAKVQGNQVQHEPDPLSCSLAMSVTDIRQAENVLKTTLLSTSKNKNTIFMCVFSFFLSNFTIENFKKLNFDSSIHRYASIC